MLALKKIKKASPKQWLAGGVAGLFALFAIGFIGAVMTGPQIGSVFSAVTKGLGGPSYASSAPAIAPAPISSGSSLNEKAPGGSAASTGNTSTDLQQGQALPVDRMIIRNATVSIRAKEVEKSINELRALATEKNGTVFQANTSSRGEGTNDIYGSIVIQVPATTFDDVLGRIRKLNGVRVDNENVTSQDVTEEFVDVQARAKNLKVTEEELQRLLAKATNVTEVMNVQRELTTVRGEIERLQGRMNYLEKRAAMSTITINVSPWSASVQTASKGWEFSEVLENAWNGSVNGLQGIATLLTNLLAWSIWLVPLLVAAILGGRFLYKRTFRKVDGATPSAFSE